MPRKPKAWTPPAALKIGIEVARGGVTYSSESTAAEAERVAKWLIGLARKVAADAPDTLPFPETVHGGVIDYTDDGDTEGGKRKPLGF